MKKIVLFIVTFLSIGIFAPSLYSRSPWVAKINGEEITLEEFNNLYYAQLRIQYHLSNEEIDKLASDPEKKSQNPYLDRAQFLNQMIDGLVVYQKAIEAGYDKKPQVKIIMEYQTYSLAGRFHLDEMLKGKVVVTDKEITEAYESNKDQFENQSPDQAKERIRQNLMRGKTNDEQTKILQELKDSAIIDKNEDVISKLSDPDKSKKAKTGTIVTIKGKNITTKKIDVQEFLTGYYAQLGLMYIVDNDAIDSLASDPSTVEQNSLLDKKNFLEQLIGQYIFYESARNAGVMKKTDVQALSKFYNMQIPILYYLREKYIGEIIVTSEELSEQYRQFSEQFQENPIHEHSKIMIKQGLINQKLNSKLPEIVQALREKAVKEKNLKLLEISSDKTK
jgi:hypothetical protein